VIRDSAGNLYGTTQNGGPAGAGVVYKVEPAGHETVLYTFTGAEDGYQPMSGVIRDSAGNLYGTTYGGGTAGVGVVYKVDTAGQQTVLYSFTGSADGGHPLAGVIRDSAGNLYGTTQYGGASGAGTVYKVDTAGHETVLYSFTGVDGSWPNSSLTRDSAGNFYGTTETGGAASAGAVYKVDTFGQETVLYSFAYGSYPEGGVIRDEAGNFYGTEQGDLDTNFGVVYKLDPAGNQTVLYRFTGGADGSGPYAGVIRDQAGNLYGTTFYGGPTGRGVVYKLDTAGQETVLYSFPAAADGYLPHAGLIGDAEGNLYGTTFGGGTKNGGVVFKLKGARRGQSPGCYGADDRVRAEEVDHALERIAMVGVRDGRRGNRDSAGERKRVAQFRIPAEGGDPVWRSATSVR
jgi:uncharacterized repeat protein (TIGR03803 family)